MASSIQPAIAPLTGLAVGITKSLASRNRNIPVQDVTVGLDFRRTPGGGRLAPGAYVLVQIPEKDHVVWSPTYNTTTNRYQTLPGFTPVYDGNGNLKADGSHTYSWDAVNNPVQLDGVGVTYDALGRMVEINATTYRTQWVYSPTGEKVELMLNGQTFAGAWIPLPGGGKRLYHISNGTVDGYTRPDWLGSARLVTSDTQTLISDVAYAPYGEDYASPSPYLQFTSGSLGENTVSASGGQGLYDFDFRKYSPAQGRWISPDPAGMAAVELSNPQTWNRYAYVGNMPTGAVDPLGLWGSDVFGTARGGGVDPLLDPGGAWLSAQIQQFMADAGLNSPLQQGLGTYLSSVYGNNNVAAGPNGFTITLAIGFSGPCSKDALPGCNTQRTYNLFQFLDPATGLRFSFDTSFANTVAAFGRAGIVPSRLYFDKVSPWHDYSLRDSRQLCSFHVDLNSSSGQVPGQPTTGGIHIDAINPLFSMAGHFVQDMIPDALNKLHLPVAAGGAACP